MAFDPSGIMDALHSKLSASGFVTGYIGEPKKAPNTRSAFVIFDGTGITETSLATGSGPVAFILRFMWDFLEEPLGKAEKDVARITLSLMADFAGDFDLGVTEVRNIVPTAPSMEAKAGYLSVGNPATMYRIVDLRIEVFVNDLVTHAK